MKVIVSRKRWGRGDIGDGLLNKEGLMCCLGFACRQLGASAREIEGAGVPAHVCEHSKVRPAIKKKLLASPFVIMRGDLSGIKYPGSSKLTNSAVLINDAGDITDKVRESRLKATFKKHGHSIVFRP